MCALCAQTAATALAGCGKFARHTLTDYAYPHVHGYGRCVCLATTLTNANGMGYNYDGV
jgi:hypothetical protein